MNGCQAGDRNKKKKNFPDFENEIILKIG